MSRDGEGIVLGTTTRGGTYITAREVHHGSVEKDFFCMIFIVSEKKSACLVHREVR